MEDLPMFHVEEFNLPEDLLKEIHSLLPLSQILKLAATNKFWQHRAMELFCHIDSSITDANDKDATFWSTITKFHSLQRCKNLISLRLHVTDASASLRHSPTTMVESILLASHLEKITSLSSLSLTTASVSPQERVWSSIRNLTNLTSLTLSHKQLDISSGELSELSASIMSLQGLTQLNLSNVSGRPGLSDEPLIDSLLGLKNLKILLLPVWVHNWHRLNPLRSLERLGVASRNIEWLFEPPRTKTLGNDIGNLCHDLIEKVKLFSCPVTSVTSLGEFSFLSAVVGSVKITETELFLRNQSVNLTFDVNWAPPRGRPPIFYAVDFRILQILVAAGANVNAVVPSGRNEVETPITRHILRLKTSEIKFLIDKGADVNLGSPPPLAKCVSTYRSKELYPFFFKRSKQDIPCWDDAKLGQLVVHLSLNECPSNAFQDLCQLIGIHKVTNIIESHVTIILPSLRESASSFLVERLIFLGINLKQCFGSSECPLAWYLYRDGSHEVRQLMEANFPFTTEEIEKYEFLTAGDDL